MLYIFLIFYKTLQTLVCIPESMRLSSGVVDDLFLSNTNMMWFRGVPDLLL